MLFRGTHRSKQDQYVQWRHLLDLDCSTFKAGVNEPVQHKRHLYRVGRLRKTSLSIAYAMEMIQPVIVPVFTNHWTQFTHLMHSRDRANKVKLVCMYGAAKMLELRNSGESVVIARSHSAKRHPSNRCTQQSTRRHWSSGEPHIIQVQIPTPDLPRPASQCPN